MQQQILMTATASLRSLQREQRPTSIRVAPYKTCGPRLEERRHHGLHMTAAHWPEDHLVETRQPVLCGVLGGHATLPMGQYQLEIPAGHFVFMPPMVPRANGSQPHLKGTSDEEFCDLFWLYRWEGGFVCHICHSRGARHYNYESTENCFLIGSKPVQYFDMLAAELELTNDAPPDSQINTSHYLLLTLLASVRKDLISGNYLPSIPFSKSTSTNPVPVSAMNNYGAICNVQNYILSHIDEALSIDNMARHAAMSRAQFTRQFRKVSGCSFLEYLTNARIDRTKQFLRETDLPLPVIARAVGLRPSQLHNLFSLHLNSTPQEFRHKARTKKKRRFPTAKSPSSNN